MYESFYGLKEKPFTLLPDPEYLYLSAKHQRALTLLEYGMMNKAGFSVICGEMGVGKTTLIRHLLTKLDENIIVGFLDDAHDINGNVIDAVIASFGLKAGDKNEGQKLQLFKNFLFEKDKLDKQMVLIVDEAHSLDAEKLEELRALANITANKDQLLQIILVGQAGLRETLRQPELVKFAQRIAVDYSLGSLSLEETSSYISHRLNVSGVTKPIFTNEACDAIYEYSNGTPRLINLLCDTALVYGYAEQSDSIDENLIHDVVREQHGDNAVLNLEIEDVDDEIPAFVKRKLENSMNKSSGTVAQVGEKSDVKEVDSSVIERTLKSSTADKIHIELEKLTDEVVDAYDMAIENLDLEQQVANEDDMFKGGALPDEVYPIVQVEAPKKSTKMLVIGMAAGMFVASAIMAVAGWYMFIANENPQQIAQQASIERQKKAAAEKKLKTLLKERNEALAATKALKQERDAALKAAETHKELHDASLAKVESQKSKRQAEELKASILAKQKVAEELKATEEKLKKLELAQQKTLEREYELKLNAQKREAEIEKQRLIELQKERKRLEKMALNADRDRLNELLSEEESSLDEPVTKESIVEQITSKDKSFSANPCDSPSAKFLSTCKK